MAMEISNILNDNENTINSKNLLITKLLVARERNVYTGTVVRMMAKLFLEAVQIRGCDIFKSTTIHSSVFYVLFQEWMKCKLSAQNLTNRSLI